MRYLKSEFELDDARREHWSRHWIAQGFAALERMLAGSADTGSFCHGDSPSMADCCLVPQIANAERVRCPLEAYPTLMRINGNCQRLPAFMRAAPGAQPDAE